MAAGDVSTAIGRDASSDSRLMGSSLAVLFFAGATFGAISLLLPHPSGSNDPALWSNVTIAYVTAAFLAVTVGRLPTWAYQVAIVGGIIVITRAIYYSAEPTGYYALWYLWAGLYSFFFFGRDLSIAYTALIGLAYAWVLTQIPQPDGAEAKWLLTVGTLAVAGLLVDYFSRRLRVEIAGSEARARNLTAIGAVAHELSRHADTAEVEPAICSALETVTGASAVAIWKPTADGRGLRAAAARGAPVKGAFVPFLAPRAGVVRTFTSGERLFASESEVDAELGEAYEARSCLWHPVVRDGVPVAVLAAYWTEPVDEPSAEVRELTRLLAAEASVAVERAELIARLERAALTDDLTGLPNRRAWEEALLREVGRAARTGEPLCVAIFDLDHFKEYNDHHGHRAGDRFLKETAANWRDLLRPSDVLARHGGEEFALALPGCSLDAATERVEELRGAVPGNETCSAGIACWQDFETPEALVNRADSALYTAKRGGRNRVRVT